MQEHFSGMGKGERQQLERRRRQREAKRAQRRRERRAGLALVQLRLPRGLAAQLLHAARGPGFSAELERFLGELLIPVREYPQLAQLAWNRRDPVMRAEEAFRLYEANWRFVDAARLAPSERALIKRLAARYGAGLLNA
jgi:hypothetical protein